MMWITGNKCSVWKQLHWLLWPTSSLTLCLWSNPILCGPQQAPHLLKCLWQQCKQGWFQAGIDQNFYAATGLKTVILQLCNPSSSSFCQFLLDCSVLPAVISAVNKNCSDVLHHLFHISRTWVYCLHRERMKLLGLLNYVYHWWNNHDVKTTFDKELKEEATSVAILQAQVGFIAPNWNCS